MFQVKFLLFELISKAVFVLIPFQPDVFVNDWVCTGLTLESLTKLSAFMKTPSKSLLNITKVVDFSITFSD